METCEAEIGKTFKEPDNFCQFPTTLTTFRKAIKVIEKGGSIDDVIAQFNISEEKMNGLSSRCEILIATKTKNNGWKYKTKTDVEKINKGDLLCNLAPTLPDGEAALRMALSIITYINTQEKDGRRKKKILRWCKLILNSYSASAHYLQIDSREDLKFLTEYANEVIPYEYWNVSLFASITEGTELKSEASFRIKDYWHKTTSNKLKSKRPKINEIKNSPLSPHGVAHVTLDIIEPKEKEWNSRAHGIGVLFYVAFMMTVIMDGV